MTAPMHWTKRGVVVMPDPAVAWMATHAMLPVPSPHGNGRFYVTGRNAEGAGQVGWCRIDLEGATPQLIEVAPQPLIPVGPLGAFDDRGASASAAVVSGGRTFLFYTGWSLGVTVPFYVFLGLAISDDGGATFTKVSRAPILDRSDDDPFLIGHPAVLLVDGVWRMWYVSCSEWRRVGGAARHYYRVKYAESTDGIHWQRSGRVCIDYASDSEYAIARPWVVKEPGGYRMWYSYRGDSYRIGYAESADGLTWQRLDHLAGIDVSAGGWDSGMIEYPCTLTVPSGTWMFYNGNDFGRTGIGCARLDAAPRRLQA